MADKFKVDFWIADALKLDFILFMTIFTIVFILILNVARAYLAYKRYIYLHLTRNVVSKKSSKYW